MKIFYFLICGREDWASQKLQAYVKYKPTFENLVQKAEWSQELRLFELVIPADYSTEAFEYKFQRESIRIPWVPD